MTTVMDDVRKIPPVTRFLCGALVTITLSIKLEAVSMWSMMFMLKEGTIGGQVSANLLRAFGEHAHCALGTRYRRSTQDVC